MTPQDDSKSNRFDSAHPGLANSLDTSRLEEPSRSWLGYAGRDPDFLGQQVDSQANELLAYVQEQQKDVDEHQAELNAKLAQLDSQMRIARLHGLDAVGPDLASAAAVVTRNTSGFEIRQTESRNSDLGKVEWGKNAFRDHDLHEHGVGEHGLNEAEYSDVGAQRSVRADQLPKDPQYVTPPSTIVEPRASVENPDTAKSIQQEFDEVERIVAQFSDGPVEASESSIETTREPFGKMCSQDAAKDVFTPLDVERARSQPRGSRASISPCPSTLATDQDFLGAGWDAFPSMLADSHLRRLGGLHGDLVGEDWDALAAERRVLAERQLELDRQRAIASRLQDEARRLYRESLEMRLVTEQLWGELSKLTPPENLKEHIARLRSQLESHYQSHYQSDREALARQQVDLETAQRSLEQKQATLRDQSARMQEWFATREQQVRSYANEVDARSSLLDRREQRLQDELAKWQAQRKDYEHQLRDLAQRLKLSGMNSPF